MLSIGRALLLNPRHLHRDMSVGAVPLVPASLAGALSRVQHANVLTGALMILGRF
jgi:hypothetical protein